MVVLKEIVNKGLVTLALRLIYDLREDHLSLVHFQYFA